jgi:hypothetical protein
MFDQSGSMNDETSASVYKEAVLKSLSEIVAKTGTGDPIPFKILIDDRQTEYIGKKFREPLFEKEFIKKPMIEKFSNKLEPGLLSEIFEKYADILAECKLTPEERAERARERGEALATACHAGTAAVTTVLRPLSFRRGFISL